MVFCQRGTSLKTIFLDLDGTLLDVSEQLYRIYADAVAELDPRALLLPKAQYMELKRSQVREDDLVRRGGYAGPLERYFELRDQKLESAEYLALAKPIAGAIETIERLAIGHRLVLVSLRKNLEPALVQLEEHGARRHLLSVHITGDRPANRKDWQCKADLVRKYEAAHLTGAIFVGDTEVDIQAGKELGITTVAVASGVRSAASLMRYQPDYLLDSVADMLTLPILQIT